MKSNLFLRMHAVVCCALIVTLVACMPLDRLAPQEQLDRRSGDTLVVVNQPLVFARERSDVAVRARDYVTVVGVEADRAGSYSAYLLVYRWSTIDRRMVALPAADAGALRIVADGREIVLAALPSLPVALQSQDGLHAPRDAEYVAWAYATDLATLYWLASSQTLSVRFPREPLPLDFSLWSDGRAALRELAGRGAAR